MNCTAVLSEAWRNIVTGASRGVWFAVALAVVGTGFGAAEVASASSLVAQAEAFQGAGANITTLVAAGAIDGRSCEQLKDLPGVSAAGALRSSGEMRILTLPGSTVPAREVTTGFLPVLGAQQTSGSGLVVSTEVAEQFGLTALGAGSRPALLTTLGDAAVAGIYDYPADGRRPGFGYGVLQPVPPTGLFDECWVRAWPQSQEIRTLIRLSMVPVDETAVMEPPLVSQLNTRHGLTFNGPAVFEERISRFGAMAAFAVSVALGFISVRSRRLELASARHSGVPALSQALQMVVESTVIAATSLVLAVSAVLSMAHSADSAALALLGIKPPVVAAAAFVVGACSGVFFTKEKHLFQYFKNR
ncbi:hypothetical protein [Paenarthrobacter aurescens]|uniref:hypothetical protein n=1 Tax=Paenarthrobacter aurescens TaxID=43663 RepID=UPI0021BF2E11|nr:hypothetical protein [Paenarthrobacter aurescens]MCT9870477.1 hypothetical protein [Paenarthrobacter aurescens]